MWIVTIFLSLRSLSKSVIVEVLSNYMIPFVGLKETQHSFDFQLGTEFFEHFEYSEIELANIRADIKLDKQSSMMILEFKLTGTVTGNCDRCMKDLSMDIDFEEQLVVKFGDESGHTDEEILVLGPQEYQIDLAQFLYEYAHLALPAKKVCEDESMCDQDVLDKLHELAPGGEEDTDPRWDALKGLK